MSAKLLEVRDLRVAYDKVEAVSGVSLSVDEGKIVTVIGPNGAGKTTLLSAIMGVLPSRGEIVFGGKRQEHAEIEEMVAAGMNLVPEKRELFAEMSVEDNLMLGAFDRFRRGLRDQDQTLAEVYDLFPRLRERRAQLSGTLSGGERQRVSIARAVLLDAPVLVLDEATAAADAGYEVAIQDALSRFARGRTVLVIAHRLDTVMHADRILVLDRGVIVEQGTHQQLLARQGHYARMWRLGGHAGAPLQEASC